MNESNTHSLIHVEDKKDFDMHLRRNKIMILKENV